MMHKSDKEPTVSDLERHAVARTRELIARAVAHFGRPIRIPPIRFDLRGKSAGQVRMGPEGDAVVRYNVELMMRNPADFIAQTVPHETAHVAAFCIFGRRIRPHGAEWQETMRLFGATPRRCHDYDVSGLETRRLRRFDYCCGCARHSLTSIRHRRIQEGATYRCRTCGEALKPCPEGSTGA